jgi:radical SAM superfamily enzyme YgiQ (UPF0313 family)
MDIVLINPPFAKRRNIVAYPLNLLILAQCLKQNNIEFSFIDLNLKIQMNELKLNRHFLKNATQLILKSNAKIFCFTSICHNFPIVVLLSKFIKKHLPNSVIILGGPYVSLLPEDILQKFRFIDYIVVGEGEVTFPNLIKILLNKSDIKILTGIGYFNKDSKLIIEKPSLLKSLDESPIPNYDIIDINKYFNYQNEKIINIEVGRGCIYSCKFCSTSIMWQRINRCKSINRILEEMKFVINKFHIRTFNLVHDNLMQDKKYVWELCDAIINSDLSIKFKLSSRYDQIDREILIHLKKAGCMDLYLGLESYSPTIQASIGKKIAPEKMLNVINMCNELNIGICTSFVFGFPDENTNDLNASIELANFLKKDAKNSVAYHFLAPLPKTHYFVKYRDELELCDIKSRTAEYIFNNHSIRELILKDKNIFSPFYKVKLKFLGKFNYNKLLYFCNIVTELCPRSFYLIRKITSLKLIQMFEYLNNTDKVDIFFYNILNKFIPLQFKEMLEDIYRYEKLIYSLGYTKSEYYMSSNYLKKSSTKKVKRLVLGSNVNVLRVNHPIGLLVNNLDDYSNLFSRDGEKFILIQKSETNIKTYRISEEIYNLILILRENNKKQHFFKISEKENNFFYNTKLNIEKTRLHNVIFELKNKNIISFL